MGYSRPQDPVLCRHKDLPSQTDLDDAVGAGRGQVMCAAGCRAGEPQGCAVRAGDDLHVHAVLLVFLRVVRLIGADAVGGNQCAVNDDMVVLTEVGDGFVEVGPRKPAPPRPPST